MSVNGLEGTSKVFIMAVMTLTLADSLWLIPEPRAQPWFWTEVFQDLEEYDSVYGSFRVLAVCNFL